jgi:hypothetical protein
MEGGTVIYNTQGPVALRTNRFYPIAEDWFTYSGCIFDIKEYSHWSKAYVGWEREDYDREVKHQLRCSDRECTYDARPERPQEADYFSPDRTPWLLSEVLASVAALYQIDLLPESFLSTAKEQTLGNSNSEPVRNADDIVDHFSCTDIGRRGDCCKGVKLRL